MTRLIDFYAEWCGPCKVMDPIMEELKPRYDGKVAFEEVDVEADGALAEKFQVMSIPTFVILKDDREVARKTGAMPREIFKEWIDSNLD